MLAGGSCEITSLSQHACLRGRRGLGYLIDNDYELYNGEFEETEAGPAGPKMTAGSPANLVDTKASMQESAGALSTSIANQGRVFLRKLRIMHIVRSVV